MGLFRRSIASPPAASPVPAGPEEEIPRYPPFPRGLPVAAVERVLATQAALLARI
jgi:hypothetical protein